MSGKILVAFDYSENAVRAVKFVAASFNPDHQVTLLGVIPNTAAVCNLNEPSLVPYFKSHQEAFCQLEDKQTELVREAMERAKCFLLDSGFKEERITLRLEAERKGVAQDILHEAQTGYDTVVLGKHGLSGIKEFFLGSVPQKVLQGSKNVSVVLVS